MKTTSLKHDAAAEAKCCVPEETGALCGPEPETMEDAVEDSREALLEKMTELELELQHAETTLRAAVQALEASNAELRLTNQELAAANERLVAKNEELYSVTQELVMVNAEYEYKIRELTELGSDMDHFLISANIGTIFLDTRLGVRRFTQAILAEVHLQASDYGRPIGQIPHTFPGEDMEEVARRVLETREPMEREIQNNGGRWFSLRVLPYQTQDRLKSGVVLTFVDITGQKNTEELLRKSEMLSAVGQLAAGIAHEIRNPLTALKGFTKLMSGTGAYNDSYLSIMSGELQRIEEIVSELLVLAKPQAVDFALKPMLPIIEDVIMLLDTQAIMSNVEIELRLEDMLPPVSCVENQLKQVFINVLKNGVEAMPGGGRLTVEGACLAGGGLRLRFIDQGCGIPESKLARLGEPFYTTKSKGTGLGLMVSYKIIENHQGMMRISSQVGLGTTVDIELPAAGEVPKDFLQRGRRSGAQG